MKEELFLGKNLIAKLFTDIHKIIYGIGRDIMLKQIVKLLIVVIILKHFNERRIHCLINMRGNARIT
jgi:hypothetical protein